MRILLQLQRYMIALVAFAALYLGWTLLTRHWQTQRWTQRHLPVPETGSTAEFDRLYGGTDVRILQFYARDGKLTEGDKSVLCYGVVNAKAVRIEPHVEGVSPSLNRCVEVAPGRDTQYTLTADGADGKAVSASFLLSVHPDADTLPRINSFGVESRTVDYRGRPVYLVSFSVRNAEEVSIDPPAFPTLHRSPNGRFYVAPEKTTTYTLTVTGKFGHKAQQQLTLPVG